MSVSVRERLHSLVDAVFDLQDRWKTGERNVQDGLMIDIPNDETTMLLRTNDYIFFYPHNRVYSYPVNENESAVRYISVLLNMYCNLIAIKGVKNEH